MKNNKFTVYMEEHSNFYWGKIGGFSIGSFETYAEALNYAKLRVEQDLEELRNDPACIYISPTPDGEEYFDSHEYENILLNKKYDINQ